MEKHRLNERSKKIYNPGIWLNDEFPTFLYDHFRRREWKTKKLRWFSIKVGPKLVRIKNFRLPSD